MGVSYHNMSVGVKLAIDEPLSDNSPSALFFLSLSALTLAGVYRILYSSHHGKLHCEVAHEKHIIFY